MSNGHQNCLHIGDKIELFSLSFDDTCLKWINIFIFISHSTDFANFSFFCFISSLELFFLSYLRRTFFYWSLNWIGRFVNQENEEASSLFMLRWKNSNFFFDVFVKFKFFSLQRLTKSWLIALIYLVLTFTRLFVSDWFCWISVKALSTIMTKASCCGVPTTYANTSRHSTWELVKLHVESTLSCMTIAVTTCNWIIKNIRNCR